MPIFLRELHIEPNIQQNLNIEILCHDRYIQLNALYLTNLRFHNIKRCWQFDKTLQSLVIHHSDTNLNDLITAFQFNALKTLNLSYNPIQNALTRFYFVNMTNVQQIILSHCLIEHLAYDTFHMVRKTIEFIDLSWNRLTQLSFGFSSIVQQFQLKLFTIKLNDNPWQCDCDANSNIIDYLNCLEMCKSHFIESSSSPSPSSSSALSSNFLNVTIQKRMNELNIATDPDTIDLQCEDLTNNQKSDTITLKRQTHNIRITFDQRSKLNLTIDGPETGYLIWFNDSLVITVNDDQTLAKHIHCNSVSQHMIIDNVVPGTTYTFCVIPSSDNDSTSPFNCIAYYVGEQTVNSNESAIVWLSNDQKTMMISFFCTINILLMLLGTLFGIYVIRKYPNCLKDSRDTFPLDNTNCFDKRGNCSPPSVFSIDDNTAVDDYVYV